VNELQKKYSTEIQRILAKYPAEHKRSAVMPLLYLAQREKGHIAPEAIRDIAELLEISATDVSAVAGFYTLFHEDPGGRYRIQVCSDLPCALRGAEQFLADLCAYLKVQVGETSADGLFIVEEVKCLAACHRAPMFQLQGDGDLVYYENQTLQTATALIEELREHAREVKA
jgi:NADH-quinone oxidoreductase subunit E